MWLVVLILLCLNLFGNCEELGYVAVNDVAVTTNNSSTESGYDMANGTYEFIEGQLAEISCQATTNDIYLLELSITNAEANRNFTTEQDTRLANELKLTADYDNEHIDCRFLNIRGILKFFIRINLELRKETLGFQVNGLKLTPVLSKDNNTVYKYDYYDGEKLAVRSYKDDSVYDNMTCEWENLPDNLSELRNNDKRPVSAINFTTTLEEKHKNVTASCSIQNKDEEEKITLYFVPQNLNYDPFIKGLSTAHILYKYTDKNATENSLTTIRYQYENDEVLSLSCFSLRGPNWSLSKSDFDPKSFKDEPINDTTRFGVFQLKSYINHSSISCISSDDTNHSKKTTVELIKGNEIPLASTSLFNGGLGSTESTQIPVSNDRNPNGGDGSRNSTLYIIIGISVFIIIAALLLFWMILGVIKRKKNQFVQNPNATNISYDNMAKLNEPQTPMPRGRPNQEAQYAAPSDNIQQDNDYMVPYVPKTIDEMYSKIVRKNQRNVPQQEPAYAAVGYVGPKYGEILPKNIRNGLVQVLPQIGNVSASGRFAPESGTSAYLHKNNAYAVSRMMPQENPYAEVTFEIETPYAEPNFKTPANAYGNVFDNQKYVNCNEKGDYVEPAYCAVDKVKKKC